MKIRFTLIAILIVLIASAFVSSQDDKKGLARVQTVLGKEVYVMCQPVRNYDVVDAKTSFLRTYTLGRGTIQKQMQDVIKRGLKAEEDKELSFDGAMTDDGERIVLIKFKD